MPLHAVLLPSPPSTPAAAPQPNIDPQQQPAASHLVGRPTLPPHPQRPTPSPDSTPRRNRSLPLARLSVSSRKGLFSANTYAPAARGPVMSGWEWRCQRGWSWWQAAAAPTGAARCTRGGTCRTAWQDGLFQHGLAHLPRRAAAPAQPCTPAPSWQCLQAEGGMPTCQAGKQASKVTAISCLPKIKIHKQRNATLEFASSHRPQQPRLAHSHMQAIPNQSRRLTRAAAPVCKLLGPGASTQHALRKLVRPVGGACSTVWRSGKPLSRQGCQPSPAATIQPQHNHSHTRSVHPSSPSKSAAHCSPVAAGCCCAWKAANSSPHMEGPCCRCCVSNSSAQAAAAAGTSLTCAARGAGNLH